VADSVFVNDRSAFHKGSSGKAMAAFPDVCLCPPPPPGGYIPTPLPNNALASDITECAKSVTIEGNPMAHRKSYISRSTGDEAGDRMAGGQGGVVTHVAKGKAYFHSYSFDVSIEGIEAVRHLDLTTHNHASPTPNTPPNPMVAKSSFKEAGKADCGPDCQISTYSPNKCPKDPATGKQKTPHHMVPKHCFKELKNGPDGKPIPLGGPNSPWKGYDPKKAPCICVTGTDKADANDGGLLQHGRIHDSFDTTEAVAGLRNNEANEWTYEEAQGAASDATKKVLQTCDKDCLDAVMEDFHTGGDVKKKKAKIRAYCPKGKKSELRKRALDQATQNDTALA
jgi:hypothetical protein